MSDPHSPSKSGGIGLMGAVFLIFLALKLGIGDTEVQTWSWWTVAYPLWIPPVILCVVIGFAFLVSFIAYGASFMLNRFTK